VLLNVLLQIRRSALKQIVRSVLRLLGSFSEPADMCSGLELCLWINSNSHMIRIILFTDEAHFTHDRVNNTRNSHLWDRENPHGTVESNYKPFFSVNVWCGVIGDQLIGPYIFPQRLTSGIYTNFLQDKLPALLENFPLQTRRQMYYQHY